MQHEQSEASRLEQANILGLAFLRTIVLLHAGALLAVITFIGGQSQDSAFTISAEVMREAITAFLVGILVMLSALLLSYTYTAYNPDTAWHRFFDKAIIPLNTLLAVTSIAAFAWGVGVLADGVAQRIQ